MKGIAIIDSCHFHLTANQIAFTELLVHNAHSGFNASTAVSASFQLNRDHTRRLAPHDPNGYRDPAQSNGQRGSNTAIPNL